MYAPTGTSVSYTVSADGYASYSDTATVSNSTFLNNVRVELTPNNYTFTISPTPSTAIVTLTADGYEQSGNAIIVPNNTEVSYTVSATGYTTQTGTYTVTADYTMSITLTATVPGSGGEGGSTHIIHKH
jgi:hypothetical protein